MRCEENMLVTFINTAMFAIYIVLPAFFIIRIWRNQSTNLLKWLSSISTSGSFILCLFFIGGWPIILTGFYTRYLLMVALILAITKSYFNQSRSFPKFSRATLWTMLSSCFAVLAPIGIILLIPISTSRIRDAVDLEFPLKNGKYYILNGGNSLFVNHHREVEAQKYALDIIKLNQSGLRCKSLKTSVLTSYNIFGEVVYSPCRGKVIELVDGFPDLDPKKMDPVHPAGNHIAIEMDSKNMTVLLAHIQKGSFLVEKGDIVEAGQPLCKVGNSGNTSEPHLHIHLVKSGDDLLFEGKGIPVKFNNRFLVRNDRFCSTLASQ